MFFVSSWEDLVTLFLFWMNESSCCLSFWLYQPKWIIVHWTNNLIRFYWWSTLTTSPTHRQDNFTVVLHLNLDESTLLGTGSLHLWGLSKHLECNISSLFWWWHTNIPDTEFIHSFPLSSVSITKICFLVRYLSLLNHQNLTSAPK